MTDWKLNLQRDTLKDAGMYFSSLSERITAYRNFYIKSEKTSAGKVDSSSYLSGTVDVHTIPSDFSCMLGLYEPSGLQYTFSSYGWQSQIRQLPSTGAIHRHAFIEILYVADGSFSQILLGKKETFHRGEIVITDRRIEHADFFDRAEGAVLFLWLQAEFLNRLLSFFEGADSLQAFFFRVLQKTWHSQSYVRLSPSDLTGKPLMELEELMEILVREDEDTNGSPGKQQLTEGALLRILHLISLHYSMQLHSADKENRDDILFFEIDRYLRGHLQSASAKELEANFHYHRNYYSRLIHKYRGCSLIDYLQQLRMEHAALLLRSTKEPVKGIAYACGYSNTSHFYHLFEHHFHVSPAQFREESKSKETGEE